MSNFEKKIEEAAGEELYFWINDRDPNYASLASDELTRREFAGLRNSIKELNDSATRFNKVTFLFSIALIFIGLAQMAIALFSTTGNMWYTAGFFALFSGFLIFMLSRFDNMIDMDVQIYELKLEINRDAEMGIVERLGLDFIKEYKDVDIYLDGGDKIFKIKDLRDKSIFYIIKLKGDIFEIRGENVLAERRTSILEESAVRKELHRTKRMYRWDKFFVKCSFDYIEEFPDRLFLEVHSEEMSNVERAKGHLFDLGFKNVIRVGYNELK